MGFLDAVGATQFGQQFGENFSNTFLNGNTQSIKDRVDDWEDWTIHWSAFDNNITSAYQNIDDLKRELSALQENTLSAQNLAIDPINYATKDAKNALCSVVKILDRFAGNDTKATAADKMLSSVVNVCNALTACIAPVTEIGFPEIPILGNIGEYLKMIMQKEKIYRMLPPEIRKQVEDRMKAEKEGKNATEFKENLKKKIKNTEIGDLLYSGYIDIVKIMANLPFLPITILFSAVSVLIDAVSKLFNVVGLGTFNFDSLIKGKGLNFNLNIQDPGFEFEPPGNILEALGKCIPLIMNSLITLPQMLINGIMENLYLIGGGIVTLGTGGLWHNHSNEFMISAINDTILSNELYIENQNYQMEIYQIDRQLSSLADKIETQTYQDQYYSNQSNTDEYSGPTISRIAKLQERDNPEFEDKVAENIDKNEEISKLKDQKREIQEKIEENNAKMESLLKFNSPDKDSSD